MKTLVAILFLIFPAPVCESAQTQCSTGNNMFPRWSHDGKKIVFTSDRDGDPEIYSMNADGSNPVRLTRAPGRDAHPFYSRDGRRILFQSPRANGKDTNIYVMNSDGSNVIQLTNLKGFAGVPEYSPDEKLIVFQWRESNDFQNDKKWRICLMNAEGGNFRCITPGDANDQVPNWSRDGKRLLFFSDRTGKNQIYIMKPDGAGVRRDDADETLLAQLSGLRKERIDRGLQLLALARIEAAGDSGVAHRRAGLSREHRPLTPMRTCPCFYHGNHRDWRLGAWPLLAQAR